MSPSSPKPAQEPPSVSMPCSTKGHSNERFQYACSVSEMSTTTRFPGPSWLGVDGRRVLAARAFRSFGYGIVSVVLGVHVADLGLGGVELGILLGAAFLGSSVLTIVVALTADRFGRRRVLVIFSAMMMI